MQFNSNSNENSDEIFENAYDDADSYVDIYPDDDTDPYIGSKQYYEDERQFYEDFGDEMSEQEYEHPEKDWDDETWRSYTEWSSAMEQQSVEMEQSDSDAATYIDIEPLETIRINAVKREVIEPD